MYKIFCDNTLIYDDANSLDEIHLIEPELKISENSSGSLTFKIASSNVGYDKIKMLSSVITVYRNNKEIWSGRPISEEIDFYKTRNITCEGELGYLNDSIQPQKEFINPTVASFLRDIIAIHNSKVDASHRFTLGTVTVTAKMKTEIEEDEYDDDIYVYTNYESTWDCISDKLLGNEDIKGHLRIRKEGGVRYLDFLKDYPRTNSQTIEFAKNLTDFTTNFDETEFCTVLIPLGERYSEGEVDNLEGYLDIRDVNGGKDYITNDAGVTAYGWLEHVEHFDDITDDEELLAKAREWLSDKQFGEMELTVSAIDLHYLDVNTEDLNLLDLVRVISRPHGLDKLFPVVEMDIPLTDPAATVFTMTWKTEKNKGIVEQYTDTENRVTQAENNIVTNQEEIAATNENLSEFQNQTSVRFEQTDTKIEAEVSNAETRMSGKITMTEYQLRSEYTNADAGLQSQITQNAGQIALKVSKGTVSSELSLEPGQVTLGTGRLIVNSTNFTLTADGTMTCKNGSFTGSVDATSGSIGGFSIGRWTIASDNGVLLLDAYGNNIQTGSLVVVDSVDFGNASIYDGRYQLDHGTTSDLFVRWNSYGNLTYTNGTSQSARRYKYDIMDLCNPDFDPRKLYDIPIRQFKYNALSEEPISNQNVDRVGFIAEEVADAYPVAAKYNSYGLIENWDERSIIPPMLYLLKEQDKRIKELEAKLNDNTTG